MRRSNAPSMRKFAHSTNINLHETSLVSSSSNCSGNNALPQNNFGQNTAQKENLNNRYCDSTTTHTKNSNKKSSALTGKRVFVILWREKSTRKHKTWKGGGYLEMELSTCKCHIRDDDGKYMGNLIIKDLNKLAECLELTVGNKEIELQDEIKTEKEYWDLRRNQVENRNWGAEEYIPEDVTAEEQKKPKGTFIFRPNLVLEMPQMPKTNVGLKMQKRQRAQDDEVINAEITTSNNDLELDAVQSEKDNNKKSKASFVFRPNLVLNTLPPTKKTKITTQQLQKTNNALNQNNMLLLPSPPAADHKENSQNHQVQPVYVSPNLVQHLRAHQRVGVQFVYNCLMGFQIPNNYGCILADEMGLGKTLQSLTVAHTLLTRGPFAGERIIQRVLIVTPSSLTANWNNEINKWLKTERFYAYVVNAKHKLSAYTRQSHIPFVIVSYETLMANNDEFSQLKFDLLICDEGHRLKNQTTKICTILKQMDIKRRLLLTGTPVQNDLQEFYTLANFVNPDIFGSYQEFRRNFEIPLEQSQCPNATLEIKLLANERAEELKDLSSKFLLRRLQEINQKYLPKKREYICFVRPSEVQIYMFQKALELYEKRKDTILKDLTPLQIITVLKKICNHPSLIAHTNTPNLFTRNLERYLPDWSEMGPFDSGKLELVQNFLRTTAVERHEKCVLVSNHTKTLDMLQGLCDFLNVKYLRLDGTMPIAQRNANVEMFNKTNAECDALVFLLSAKAGGVGLNLIGASRLILFDNDWNPATDAQAMSRIWRDGQQKDVQIYRLVTAGCIEEKIFQRQVAKMSLGDCALQSGAKSDDGVKFTADELLDLFTLQEDFTLCQTHESLNCNCGGDGIITYSDKSEMMSKNNRQINELLHWEHYEAPFDEEFLQDACLNNSNENLVYIFSNQTEITNIVDVNK